MNSLIKQQLYKVKSLKIPHFDEETTYLYFSKTDVKKQPEFCIDKYFVISLDNELLTNINLAERWNSCNYPPAEYMLIVVLNIVGKMIKVEGVAYNPITGTNSGIPWTGWLPISQINIEIELED